MGLHTEQNCHLTSRLRSSPPARVVRMTEQMSDNQRRAICFKVLTKSSPPTAIMAYRGLNRTDRVGPAICTLYVGGMVCLGILVPRCASVQGGWFIISQKYTFPSDDPEYTQRESAVHPTSSPLPPRLGCRSRLPFVSVSRP